MLDCVAVLPGLISWESYYPLYWVKLVRYKQVFRYFKSINRILQYVSLYLPLVGKTNLQNIIKLVKLVFTLALVLHVFACIQLAIGSVKTGWLTVF